MLAARTTWQQEIYLGGYSGLRSLSFQDLNSLNGQDPAEFAIIIMAYNKLMKTYSAGKISGPCTKMLRSTSLITPLTATDPFAVIDGYNNLRGILAPYNVGLVHFEGIQLGFKELGLCIPHVRMETYLEMGVA